MFTPIRAKGQLCYRLMKPGTLRLGFKYIVAVKRSRICKRVRKVQAKLDSGRCRSCTWPRSAERDVSAGIEIQIQISGKLHVFFLLLM